MPGFTKSLESVEYYVRKGVWFTPLPQKV